MTTDAVADQLHAQAASFTTTGSAVPDLSKAQAATADAADLLARLQKLEADAQAAAIAANPPPDEPDDTLHVEGNAPGWMHELAACIERRLTRLEERDG